MLNPEIWVPVDNMSPGYVGKFRNEEWAKRDARYGKDNWRMAWVVNDLYLEYVEACLLYEDSYYHFFQQRPEVLEHLISTARDVYDDEPENVHSGFDYSKRGDVRTHIQDISIRRCLMRLGRSFRGSELVQIRDRLGPTPLSMVLSPGQVPFHRPEWLSKPDNLAAMHADCWWLPGSVEDFYQRAKRLTVRRA